MLNGGGHVGASDLLPSASGLSFETDIVGPASQLADTIEALLRDTDALRHVGSAAMAVARQWSEEANARQLIEYVQAALGSKPPKTDELLPEQAKPRAGAPCSGPKGSESGAQLQRGGIDVVQAAALTYDEFEQRYLARNRPVILQGVTDHWKAARDWVLPGGEVNIHFLDEEFGAAAVSVTDCSRYGDSNEPSCHAMTVSQYCAWWRGHHAKGDSAAASCQSISSSVRDSEPRPPHGSQDGTSQGLLYLKDWHFALDFPGYQAYTCPPFFQDDWLNDWYDAQHAKRTPSAGDVASDYRFVYLGPAGTKTPLHADVLRSHSWSANVAGRKLWRLLPAEFGHLVYHANGRTTASDFFLAAESAENGSAGGFNPYPGLAQAQEHVLEVEQLPGEAIFVPSGWFHTVTNLEDCCSINHNWISSHSLGSTWAHVCTERAQAADLIADCRVGCSPAEFESLVQRNVRINCSLDYAGVGALIRDIATAAAVCVLEPGSVGEEKEEEAEVGRHAPRAVARLNAAVDVLEAMLREERPMAVEESDGRTARETGACGAGEGAGKVAEWCRAGTEVAANEACLKLIHQALAAHRALQRT